jgi:hypothetical protein
LNTLQVKVGAELELGGDHGPANTVSCQEQNFADKKQVKLKYSTLIMGHNRSIGPVKVGAELELGCDHGPANTVSCQELNLADDKQIKLDCS